MIVLICKPPALGMNRMPVCFTIEHLQSRVNATLMVDEEKADIIYGAY
jgi:hypothetical protein